MIVGKSVQQVRLNSAGDVHVVLTGVVVACERGGTPASWSALVQVEDGSLKAVPVEYLRVLEVESSAMRKKSKNKPEESQ
jgi:hypothetical protein